MNEGRTIQLHLPLSRLLNHTQEQRQARKFAHLMFQGKLRAALRLVSDQCSSGVLNIDQEIDGTPVLDPLTSKQTPALQASSATLLSPNDRSLEIHPILFEAITGDLIRSTSLRVQGSAGPSGMDTAGWRYICIAFHGASKELYIVLAAMTRRICTSFVDPSGLTAFIACRLVPLNKNSGVRPIGICETIGHIIGKAILKVTRVDILSAVGPHQLSAGQDAGCEAAVHIMRSVFNDGDTEGVLLIDAKNAYNSLNRATAIHNIQVLCPSLAPTLINLYRSNTELFVNGESILLQEGTTQGDPLAMAMYALGIYQCSLHSWCNSDLVCRTMPLQGVT